MEVESDKMETNSSVITTVWHRTQHITGSTCSQQLLPAVVLRQGPAM